MAAENDNRIEYIEFGCVNLARVKKFYSEAFGWSFEDWGPDYASFQDGRLAGGFTTEWRPAPGGPLVVLYGSDLAAAEARIRAAGGQIVRATFAFPGGRRFHFADPDGNVLAVWSEAE